MNRKILIPLAVILLLALVMGCEESPTGTEDESKAAIQENIIDDSEGYFSFDKHYGESDTSTVKGVKGDDRYVFWWRQPNDFTRNITIGIKNDSAFVSYVVEAEGIFNLLVADTMPPDTIINHQKDLQDYLLRYAIFKRDTNFSQYRGWKLEKITGAEITSDTNTVQIDSIRIQCNSYADTVLSDPHAFFHRDSILTFSPGEAVTLTLYTTDSVHAFLHARGKPGGVGLLRWWRWKFNEISPGVWTGTWYTPLHRAIRPVIFDILHKNTLDDNTYPYDSNVWIFPYRVK